MRYRKESTLFYHQNTLHFERNEFSQHYWQESFDGDSFVSQSRLDAYAHLSRGVKINIPAGYRITQKHPQAMIVTSAVPNK